MSEEIEKKIQRLVEIRHDQKTARYLTAIEAHLRIQFLVELVDELTEALFKIHAAIQEIRKNDPNIDHDDKRGADPLAS